jgi:hypothetical protein
MAATVPPHGRFWRRPSMLLRGVPFVVKDRAQMENA